MRLSDRRRIAAELVVVAVGTRPNAALARDAGLHVGRGVVVEDAAMRSSNPDVLAIGECAAIDGQCCGLVPPALTQAEVAARTVIGEDAQYVAVPDATALKVAGAGVWSADAVKADGAEPDRAARRGRRAVPAPAGAGRPAGRRNALRRTRPGIST